MNVTVFPLGEVWMVSLNRTDLGQFLNGFPEKDRAVKLGKNVADFLQCELKVA